MIRVTVKPFYYLSHVLGNRKEIEVTLPQGATILDLLSFLRKFHNLPDEMQVDKYTLEFFKGDEIRSLTILKDGRNIRSLDGLKTRLEDGAVVAIFPLVAGG